MIDAVTGAFSYSGAVIAAELQRRGRSVRTLTNHPPGDRALTPEQRAVEIRPLPVSYTHLDVYKRQQYVL